MNLIIIIGFFYIILGSISLLIPLLYIELGRPRDFIKAGIFLILGIVLIIYKNIFTNLVSLIIFLNTILMIFYIFENFLYRWNQLLEKEKFEILGISGLKKNFSIIYKIISLDLKNIFFNNNIKNISKNTSIKKKWVRNQDNIINSIDKEASSKQYMTNNQTADFSKKDIINDEKIT